MERPCFTKRQQRGHAEQCHYRDDDDVALHRCGFQASASGAADKRTSGTAKIAIRARKYAGKCGLSSHHTSVACKASTSAVQMAAPVTSIRSETARVRYNLLITHADDVILSSTSVARIQRK